MSTMSDVINAGVTATTITALTKTGPVIHNGQVYAIQQGAIITSYAPMVERVPNHGAATGTPVCRFPSWQNDPVLAPSMLRIPHSTTVAAPS